MVTIRHVNDIERDHTAASGALLCPPQIEQLENVLSAPFAFNGYPGHPIPFRARIVQPR